MVLKKHSMKKLRSLVREYRKRCPGEKLRKEELYAILSRCDQATFDAVTSKKPMCCDFRFIRPLRDFLNAVETRWAGRKFPIKTFTKAFFIYGEEAGDIAFEVGTDGSISWKPTKKFIHDQDEVLKGMSVPSNQSLH